MVTSKQTLEKIREIIDKYYNRLTISVLGNSVFSEEDLNKLKSYGIDVDNKASLLELIYNHNFINNPLDTIAPKDLNEMLAQQSVTGLIPTGDANSYSVSSLNDQVKQLVDKLKIDVATRIESIIRENNNNYKLNALQNLDRTNFADELVKESSLGKIKRKLRDTSKDANRDWQRVAITEMSNAIGAGSIDRIVTDNKTKDLNEVFVYRVTVKDSVTCKWCRRFYNDSDGSPKVYKLSTLLSNGSNYGKKPEAWQPVTGATHPNTRTSQIIELKPGWKLSGDKPTFIGLDAWTKYIQNKITE